MTAKAGDATRFAQEADRRGTALVVVFGGDGTIREAANGVLGRNTPLLVVPSGTENILAKYLDIRANPDQLVRVIRDGAPYEVDAIRRGVAHFLLVAGIGFDAEVVRRLAEARTGHISYASYFWPIWRTFWSYRHPQVYVRADGATIFRGRGMVFIGNVPRYAIGLRLLQLAHPADGMMDICVFPCISHLSLIRHSVNALLRRHLRRGRVIYRQARRVEVSADGPVNLEIDGDLGSPLPAVFEVAPRAVRFLVAADWHRRAGIDALEDRRHSVIAHS